MARRDLGCSYYFYAGDTSSICLSYLMTPQSQHDSDISAGMKVHHVQLNLSKTELVVLPAKPTMTYPSILSRLLSLSSRKLGCHDWWSAVVAWSWLFTLLTKHASQFLVLTPVLTIGLLACATKSPHLIQDTPGSSHGSFYADCSFLSFKSPLMKASAKYRKVNVVDIHGLKTPSLHFTGWENQHVIKGSDTTVGRWF